MQCVLGYGDQLPPTGVRPITLPALWLGSVFGRPSAQL